MNLCYLFLIAATVSFAQIPTGYYNTATGTGYTLKTNLYNIIKNHNAQTYGDLWTLYTNTAFRDHYYENDNSLLDVYSEKPNGPDAYSYTSTSQQCGSYSGEGGCYNREHTIPQSVFNSQLPMYSDGHFVIPSDGYVNGIRSNYPYGKVGTATYTSSNGSKKGNNLNSGYSAGYTGVVFEPIDEFKGDIARCLFYFATRYQDVVSGFTYDMFNGSSDQVFTNTFLNILIKWHLDDPVSAYEIAKNNAVYVHQNNRNPYIDHPEYICMIWGTQCAALANENFVATNQEITIYPNPTSQNFVTINSALPVNNIEVYAVNGQLIQAIHQPAFDNNEYQLNNLSSGFYLMKISLENGSSVLKKVIVN